MKALVLFRSYYGNTKLVAEALAKELGARGAAAEVRDLRRRLPDLAGVDLVLVGAPTRMARVTWRAKSVLKKLKRKGFIAGKVAVFDTYGPIPKTPEELEKGRKWLYPGAAGILHKTAVALGLNVHPAALRCEVSEMKGPISDAEMLKTADFVAEILSGQAK
jgi:multimeric flavodoxin WrbA